MRQIKKGKEPASLTEHKKKTFATYDNYGDKDGVRKALVEEQRGICCYCMKKIQPNSKAMKIEHYKCQYNHPDLQLEYTNLLGACLGNANGPRKMQHCDTYKGRSEFSRTPANPDVNIGSMIRYTGDGSIYSDDKNLDAELNRVLNLNVAFLKNNRKAVLDGFKAGLAKRGKLTRPTLERWLQKWNGESSTGALKPYCQVIVYWLEKRLKRS